MNFIRPIRLLFNNLGDAKTVLFSSEELDLSCAQDFFLFYATVSTSSYPLIIQSNLLSYPSE